jgi:hypothetical protein
MPPITDAAARREECGRTELDRREEGSRQGRVRTTDFDQRTKQTAFT